MCRIAGMIGKPTRQQVENVLLAMQSGGMDATGFAWWDGKQIFYAKAPMKAEDFLSSEVVKKEIDKMVSTAQWVLFHTRQATHGSPSDNNNNHPITNNKGIIIHNGVVWLERSYPSKGQTDTEQLMLHIQKQGFRGLSDMIGWYAIAYVDYMKKGAIYLSRFNAPIVYDFNPDFVFASTQEILNILGGGKGKELPSNGVYRAMKNNPLVKTVRLRRKKHGFKSIGKIYISAPIIWKYPNLYPYYEETKKV